MGRNKQTRINQQQKTFIDMYTADYTMAAAYSEAYGIENYDVCRAAASRLIKKEYVQEYLKFKQAELALKYTITKEMLIKDLLKTKERFDEMWELGGIEEPTDIEVAKLRRLNTLLKGSDIQRVNEQLAKMLGFNEPEKLEVKQEWNISFGEDEDNTEELGEDDE